jgi:glycosyltransferase involved in cell wall biosynthesis
MKSGIIKKLALPRKTMISRPNNRRSPSILFIVSSDYDSLLKKGVASMILERDEGGFFEKVFNFHPYGSKTQTLNLNETHRLIELGPDYSCYFSQKYELGRILNLIPRIALTIKTLFSLVRREHIGVIRATDPFWCGFYAWVVSRLTGVPFCISIHADYDKCYRLDGRKGGVPILLKILERFVLPRAHLVMPISEYLRNLVRNHGVASEKIRIFPHGVNVERFHHPPVINLTNEFLIPKDKKILCMVGRLSRQKYVYDVIEVARRLVQERDDFILIFVGDGEERKGLELIVEKERLFPNVRIMGFQSNERVAAILSQSYLAFCLLAGLALIEACVVGVPAVCYDIEWHTELIKNGETGLIVKEGDLDALTERVIYLLDHPEEAKKMGARACEIAIIRHDILRTSEIKNNCYREILNHGFLTYR